MTFAEMLREEGKEALARTAIRLITKFVAPVPEDLTQKFYQQDIPKLEAMIDRIDEWETIDEVEQYVNDEK